MLTGRVLTGPSSGLVDARCRERVSPVSAIMAGHSPYIDTGRRHGAAPRRDFCMVVELSVCSYRRLIAGRMLLLLLLLLMLVLVSRHFCLIHHRLRHALRACLALEAPRSSQ